MQTTVTETLFTAEPAKVYSATLGVVRRLWSVTSDDILDAQPGERLIHAVRLDGETGCWLAWELSSVGPATTRVRLLHDDADLRDAPEPDLDGVLDRLRAALDETAAGRYSTAPGEAD